MSKVEAAQSPQRQPASEPAETAPQVHAEKPPEDNATPEKTTLPTLEDEMKKLLGDFPAKQKQEGR